MDMNKIREAITLATELTELNFNNYGSDDVWDSIQQVRELLPVADAALAELDKAQKVLTEEPVAWMTEDGRLASVTGKENMPSAADKAFCIPLYLAPAAGLTVEEIVECAWNSDYIFTERMEDDFRARLTAAMEAKAAKQ